MYSLDVTFWNGKHPLSDEAQRLFKELVPRRGEADTLNGELLRAANQLIYDHYNNGSFNIRLDHAETLRENKELFKEDVREAIEEIYLTLDELRHMEETGGESLMEELYSEYGTRQYERALRTVMEAVVKKILRERNEEFSPHADSKSQ